uniref:Transmembrane protein n=1 Tax=Chromera velia CCMP2878 TaxID=1169474 RepID=A0A0K6S6T8_9ALVE|eukprot:Cvel_17539.t1-p1 / transcript=Cvel_17539.t1 / gene=Cvel_17539 / organism=Chromera_velia_CCMP2878 / gene_product=hypothetical protein / transcript_product=hypothetical protein / location=Cvel_scaffold1407:11375-14544(-) / protein_length=554 / sequence_SO=supercontig / SO=protein_coding / is_pseudo=false
MHACNRLEGFCLASLLILAPIVCGLSGTLDDGLSCLPRNSPCADVRTPACGFHPWTEWASDPQDPLYKARTRKPFPTPCHCTSPTETEEDEGGETCETEERLYVEPQSPLGRWSCLSSPLSRRSSVSFASSASKDAVGAAALDCSDESVDFLNVFTREGSEGFLSRAPDVLSLRTDGYSEGERGTGCVPASLVTPSTFVPWAVFHEPRARFVNANGTETVVRGAIQCPSSLESVYWCPPKERGLDVFLSREGKGHMGWGWDSPTVFAVVGSAFARRDPNVVPFGLYPFDSKTCDVRNRETGLGCYPGSGNNETWAQVQLQNQIFWNVPWAHDDKMASGYNSHGVKLWWGYSEVPVPRGFDDPSRWDAVALKLPAGADNLWSLTAKAREQLPNIIDGALDLERDPVTAGGWREESGNESREERERAAEAGLFLGKPFVILNELADENGNFRRHFFCQDFDFVWADGSGKRGAMRTGALKKSTRTHVQGGGEGEGSERELERSAHCRLCDERRGGSVAFENCLKGIRSGRLKAGINDVFKPLMSDGGFGLSREFLS